MNINKFKISYKIIKKIIEQLNINKNVYKILNDCEININYNIICIIKSTSNYLTYAKLKCKDLKNEKCIFNVQINNNKKIIFNDEISILLNIKLMNQKKKPVFMSDKKTMILFNWTQLLMRPIRNVLKLNNDNTYEHKNFSIDINDNIQLKSINNIANLETFDKIIKQIKLKQLKKIIENINFEISFDKEIISNLLGIKCNICNNNFKYPNYKFCNVCNIDNSNQFHKYKSWIIFNDEITLFGNNMKMKIFSKLLINILNKTLNKEMTYNILKRILLKDTLIDELINELSNKKIKINGNILIQIDNYVKKTKKKIQIEMILNHINYIEIMK